VIDGDSFAHRAYHALPKSIRRKGNKGAGAIVRFGNFLLRFYESEQARAVVVGWDTLDAPTHRQKLFAGYQAGRSFEDELLEHLKVCQSLWRRAASPTWRRRGSAPPETYGDNERIKQRE
jgi:DNA polymerase I